MEELNNIEIFGDGIKLLNNVIEFANAAGFPELLKGNILYLRDKIEGKKKANLVNTFLKIKRKLDEAGIPYIIKPVELKVSVSILEEASLEEDDFMQELWANLIMNASIENFKTNVNITCVDVIRRLTPQDAKILLTIYKNPYSQIKNGVITKDLPTSVIFYNGNGEKDELDFRIDEEIEFSLGNLERLGCIAGGTVFDSGTDYHLVSPTILGKKVYETCTLDFENFEGTQDM